MPAHGDLFLGEGVVGELVDVLIPSTVDDGLGDVNGVSHTVVIGVMPMRSAIARADMKVLQPSVAKSLIVVLENLNLPLPDKYNCQSANCLIRQYINYGFWRSSR
jgi:hypothetical protein